MSAAHLVAIGIFIVAVSSVAGEPDPIALYSRHCANCHGAHLQGGSARGLLDGQWEFVTSDADLFRVINEGVPDAGMPDFDPLFTDDEVAAIVAYIRKLEGAKRAIKASEDHL